MACVCVFFCLGGFLEFFGGFRVVFWVFFGRVWLSLVVFLVSGNRKVCVLFFWGGLLGYFLQHVLRKKTEV